MSLISTEWLEKNLSNVKIIDGSWHMPATNRSGKEEFNKEHIPLIIDQLKEEGLLFGPKVGLTYKPNDFTSF